MISIPFWKQKVKLLPEYISPVRMVEMPDRFDSKFPACGFGLLPYGHHFHTGEMIDDKLQNSYSPIQILSLRSSILTLSFKVV